MFRTPLTIRPGSKRDYRLTFVSTSLWVRPTENSPFRLIAGTGVASVAAKDDCACGIDIPPGSWNPIGAANRTDGALRFAVAWAPKRTGAFEVVVSNTIARTENRRTQHYLSGTFNYHLRLTRQD
ncbi:MAG: hypothetical protein ACYC2K_09015 [Gemmatimonadales bacterium]